MTELETDIEDYLWCACTLDGVLKNLTDELAPKCSESTEEVRKAIARAAIKSAVECLCEIYGCVPENEVWNLFCEADGLIRKRLEAYRVQRQVAEYERSWGKSCNQELADCYVPELEAECNSVK